MQKITTFLWFDDNAEEAINFYTSVFPNSRMGGVTRMPDGKFVTASFVLDGVEFMALNGGPRFTFSEATSLFVNCKDQAEVDELWAKLSEGGEEQMCGWLKDRFGVSWQIIPSRLAELLNDPDPGRAGRATQAMLQMRKIDIAELERAAAG